MCWGLEVVAVSNTSDEWSRLTKKSVGVSNTTNVVGEGCCIEYKQRC
jgi:hypothetical protein